MRRPLLLVVLAVALLVGGSVTSRLSHAEAPRNVELGAVLTEGAQPLPDVTFTVTRRGGTTAGQVVAEQTGGPAHFQLEPGRYQVIARAHEVEVVSDIVVGAESSHRFDLNLRAGVIKLRLIPGVNRAPFKKDVSWEIYTYGKGADGKRKLIAQLDQPRPDLVLREGWYFVVAKRGDRRVRHSVEVTKGITYTYSVVQQ